jgi:hypothetical protein
VSLSDGDVAALAERAAISAPAPVTVRIEPDSGDDPYRWGAHFWTVHFQTADGDTASVRLAAEDSENDAGARLAAAVEGLRTAT